jgi:hypothetical protein
MGSPLAVSDKMTTPSTTAIYVPIIVAFGVVVLTTLGNTLLEWYRYHLTNKHSAVTLRRALVEELRLFKESAATNSMRSDNVQTGGSMIIPVAEKFAIYETNIHQLGVLRPAEVSAVVYAYAMLRAQMETLGVIGTFRRPDGVLLQAIVDAEWGEILAQNNRDLGTLLGATIDVLEGRAASVPSRLRVATPPAVSSEEA